VPGALDGGPDLIGVVLDPTRPRVVLRDLGVAAAADLARPVIGADDDRRRAGRAFV
jgi:hypothetical protein